MRYKSEKLLEDGLDTENSVSSWACICMYTAQSARIFSKDGKLIMYGLLSKKMSAQCFTSSPFWKYLNV